MTTIEEHGRGNALKGQTLGWGFLPLIIVCLLLRGLVMSSPSDRTVDVIVFAACGIVLWLGWSAIRRNILTRWLGILLAIFVGLFFGLLALGIAVGFAFVLFPLLLLAFPFVVYDLFFRAPAEGRFARAREERRHRKNARRTETSL